MALQAVVSTTTTVVSAIVFMSLAAVGAFWLWTHPDKFDGHNPQSARGVRLYLIAFCMILIVLGAVGLALYAAGDG